MGEIIDKLKGKAKQVEGDVTGDRAIIWSRSDRPARLVVEWATSDAFRNPRTVLGPAALAPGDFTARVDLTELPPPGASGGVRRPRRGR